MHRRMALAAAIALVMLYGVRVNAQTSDGRIVFWSNTQTAANQVYTMNSDGSDVRLIATNGNSPRWSPDGKKIAFSCILGDFIWGICVTDADGGSKAVVSNPGKFGTYEAVPSWSPDGKYIAFYSNRSGINQIYVIGADGSGLRQLTTGAGSSDPSWSPAGDKIAFIKYVDVNKGLLYTMNASDGEDLKQVLAVGDISYPKWSPDGSKIAFVSNRDTISWVTPDGSTSVSVGGGGRGVNSPSWSPNGDKIVFSNPNGSRYVIQVANVNGGGVTTLSGPAVTNDLEPDWQPSQKSNPLIVIPGIAGSQLRDPAGYNVWLSVAPTDLSTLAALAGTDLLQPIGLLGRVGVGPVSTDVGYATLIDRLTDPQQGGYRAYKIDANPSRLTEQGCDDQNQKKDNPNLFIFPYNWTKSNAENSAALRSYVRCVQKFYPGTKVDIVAHSMGGLLARRYILDNLAVGAGGGGQHSVNKLITIGSPFLGAPKAIYALETGYFLDILNPVLGPMFKPVVMRSPGAHQLIPTDSYFGLGGTPFIEAGFDVDASGNGAGTQVYDYNRMVTMLDFRFRTSRNTPGTENRQFHGPFVGNAGQDDFRVSPGGVKYFHLIGVQKAENTIGVVHATSRVVCGPLRTNCQQVGTFTVGRRVLGDGTVPYLSLSKIGTFNQSLNAPDAVQRIYPSLSDPPLSDDEVSHTGLVKSATVIKDVISILKSGSLAATTAPASFDTAAIQEPASPGRYLQVIGTDSIAISDTDGNTNAPIPDTPFVQQVPGITYDVIGPATTSIAMQTGRAYTYTFRVGTIPLVVELTEGTSDVVTKAIRYTDLGLTAGTLVRLTVTPTGETELRNDANSDGTFETVIQPTATVTGVAAQDGEGPAVTVTGVAEGLNVRLQIAAADNASGVKSIFYSLDGAKYQPYTGSFTVDPNQGPVVYAFAEDNSANRSVLVTYYPSLTANPLGNAQFFVRQHYHDFLNREPDASGLQFWVNNIAECGTNAQCVEVKRINVSAAFFLSIEFKETGYLAYRAHKAAYGNLQGKPVPITRQEMLDDMQVLGSGVVVGAPGWQERVEQNKQSYFDQLVTSARFAAIYPQSMTPAQFVDALNTNTAGALSAAERDQLVADLTGGVKTRAQVLRAVVEDPDLDAAEKNKAFVLMQFFGYLRRDPDSAPDSDFSGYNFWLGKLNQFGGDFIRAEMVKAFIDSIEFRRRFGQ
jgi:pimeloyl-ACP methyl ester carboxylesterase